MTQPTSPAPTPPPSSPPSPTELGVPLWSWHSGQNVLVTPIMGPDGKPAFLGFPGQMLRAMGWKGSDEDYRKSLPRFGAPTLATRATAADVQQAAVQARLARGVDSKLRGR